MYENPSSCADVVIYDGATDSLHGSEYVYRVAIFGELTEKWMEEWRETFYDIKIVKDHCSHMALVLHQLDKVGNPRFLEGYGPITWVEHNWRRVAIMNKTGGKEVAFALIKLYDRSGVTDKIDIVEVADAEWTGTEPVAKVARIGK